MNTMCWMNSGPGLDLEQKTMKIPCGGLQLCDILMWFAPGLSDPNKCQWDSQLFMEGSC